MGYLSHQAKVYLADVHDHVEYVQLAFWHWLGIDSAVIRDRYIMSSLDMFSSISENLINYTFNVRAATDVLTIIC